MGRPTISRRPSAATATATMAPQVGAGDDQLPPLGPAPPPPPKEAGPNPPRRGGANGQPAAPPPPRGAPGHRHYGGHGERRSGRPRAGAGRWRRATGTAVRPP